MTLLGESLLPRLEPPAPAGRPVLERLDSLVPASGDRAELVLPTLRQGEHYRFHFDMTRCIGCRSCEVACNEQNNNPPDVAWRHVGEVEGGEYPHALRFHLSMACNHCLEPPCLEGCPVDAYTKLTNGIVKHDAETCIGCQYCTWTCPYGIPQYHAERRVVTKCHMCADRISGGDLPACVEACPTTAIRIEPVDVANWQRELAAGLAPAEAPGLPPAAITGSTTRFTLPERLPASFGKTAAGALAPEAPHWALIILLVLSQWSLGLFALALVLEAFAPGEGLDAGARPSLAGVTAITAFLVAAAALSASTFHLGRPVHALRAMKGWRHSWLSREAALFLVFGVLGAATASSALAAGCALGARGAALGALSLAAGIAGVSSSAGIYLLPARPAWNSWRTPVQFFLTGIVLAAASGLALLAATPGAEGLRYSLAGALSAASLGQALVPWTIVASGLRGGDSPLRRTALLLTGAFARHLWTRTALAGSVAVLAPMATRLSAEAPHLGPACLLAMALAGEVLGRYLFFVTVVPLEMPGHFFSKGRGHGP